MGRVPSVRRVPQAPPLSAWSDGRETRGREKDDGRLPRAKEKTVRTKMRDQGYQGGMHSAVTTRNESINDIIERMSAEYQHTDPSIGRPRISGSVCVMEDVDPLADMDASALRSPVAYGPTAMLGIFGRMLRRTRWALYRNQGRAANSWSAGERLSVALVLGDHQALAELGYTPEEAADAVSAVLALSPAEFDGWIGELRAVL
jgi:hypothetical protein